MLLLLFMPPNFKYMVANACFSTYFLWADPRRTKILVIMRGGGLISLWLYKGNNKLRDWKTVFTYFPLSSTHLWLCYCIFFNPPKKIPFGCAANRKSQTLISNPTYIAPILYLEVSHNDTMSVLMYCPVPWIKPSTVVKAADSRSLAIWPNWQISGSWL
jgi:hypothetical protein